MLLQCAHAETLFRPRAVLGYATYDLTAGASDLASSNYTTLGVGATLARDQFYVDAIVANTLNARYDNHDTNTVEDFSRQDVTLTVGMAYTLYLSDTHGFLFKGAYQSYHFKDWNDSSATIPDIDETIVSVDAGYFVNF